MIPAYDCGKARSCATCAHKTPLGVQPPPACAGCIVLGKCTKWKKDEKGRKLRNTTDN